MKLRRGRVYELIIPVLPVIDGCLEVTITAFTFLYSDVEVVELCTQVNLHLLDHLSNVLLIIYSLG